MLHDSPREASRDLREIREALREYRRPPLAWDRLILKAPEAAKFLKMPESTFKSLAARGELERHPLTDGTYGYYAYDLLDWFLSR